MPSVDEQNRLRETETASNQTALIFLHKTGDIFLSQPKLQRAGKRFGNENYLFPFF